MSKASDFALIYFQELTSSIHKFTLKEKGVDKCFMMHQRAEKEDSSFPCVLRIYFNMSSISTPSLKNTCLVNITLITQPKVIEQSLVFIGTTAV